MGGGVLVLYRMIGLSWLSRPQYIYRPSQLVRRLTQRRSAEPVVQTPWGCRMLVARRDLIGGGIARMGVHELAVSEVMWRLAEDDELAIDVGANIGYFTGLLACRAREVTALEPNPRLRRFIVANIERWEVGKKVRLETRAASDSSGTALLHLPDDYESNYGVATLEAHDGTTSYDVETVRLDDVIEGRHVGVLKLDVEGHEMTALRGAGGSLAQGLIRDIIFEDHQPFPSPVATALQSAGFTIRGIQQTLTRPVLVPPDRAHTGWDAPTYLATRDPDRTNRLMAPRGWRCLRGR
jgi:FkbM family methyltransferase